MSLQTAADRRPLGILGGTFDPIHFGHLRLAEEGREALGLAGVRLIPAGRPPHRGVPQVSGKHRLAMTRLAAADNPAFEVDDAEVLADQPSYTVLTLERLRALFGPEQPLVLLVGADAFQGLPTWFRWQELFGLAHVAVAGRPGYTLEAAHLPAALEAECKARSVADAGALAHAPAGAIMRFELTPLAISATGIRDRLAGGRSARYLAPQAVLDYIAQHSLYV